MTNREGDVVGATGFGAAIGWMYAQSAAIGALIPPWLGQLAVTLFISCATLVATHFLKRELNRRWPDRKRPASHPAAATEESQEKNGDAQ
jgi:hypothetical protein